MQEKVCTVVLNWNGWRETAACLASLQQVHYQHHEVIVVDNGSTDDSVNRLRRDFPLAEVVENGKNLGFAGGCNVGIRRALADKADFVWLLNADTIVDRNALSYLVEKAKSNERIAAVGSAIYSMQERHRLRAWGGGHINFLFGCSRHFLHPVADAEIDYITGASLLLRRTALESVGMLDEHFFFFWEDADLGLRLRQAKWKLAVAGDSKVWHKESSSLRGQDATLDTYFNQSAMLFFRKHAVVPQIPLYIGVGLRMTKRIFAGDWDRARAVWSACRQAYP